MSALETVSHVWSAATTADKSLPFESGGYPFSLIQNGIGMLAHLGETPEDEVMRVYGVAFTAARAITRLEKRTSRFTLVVYFNRLRMWRLKSSKRIFRGVAPAR